MICFSKVCVKNFFSVGNSPIEINLNTHKRTLCIGKNGSSKSSCILDSIVFALYGKPYRKIPKPNIINAKNKSNTLVTIEFSIGSNEYKVVRGLKPNIFEIYCNDILINQDAKSKDYQEYLEKYILKVNYNSFINVVILGTARLQPFMQMSQQDRRNIIEELLDIKIFSTMNILVKEKISKIKEELNSVNYNINLTKEKIKLQKQNIEDHKLNKQEQIEQKTKEIEKYNSRIIQTQNDIELIQKHIDVLKKKIYDKENVESKKEKYISLESKIESNILKLKKETEFYEGNDSCPTCRQEIVFEFRREQIQKNNKKKQELKEGLEKLSTEMDKVVGRLKEIQSVNKHIVEHQSEIVKLNTSIIEIQKYITKETNLINDINNGVEKLEENNDKLNEFIVELKQHEQRLNQINDLKKYYEFSGILLKDGGIKTRIIKQYLPSLNKMINAYLSQMDFYVNFNITETFDEVIKSRNRDEFRYNNFSEGEKLRIDIAILFAFRQIAKMKNSVNTNLLIMDEILDASLDIEGTDQFLDVINGFSNDTNIIIISHKGDQMGEKFDRTLKFEKKKDFTRLKEI